MGVNITDVDLSFLEQRHKVGDLCPDSMNFVTGGKLEWGRAASRGPDRRRGGLANFPRWPPPQSGTRLWLRLDGARRNRSSLRIRRMRSRGPAGNGKGPSNHSRRWVAEGGQVERHWLPTRIFSAGSSSGFLGLTLLRFQRIRASAVHIDPRAVLIGAAWTAIRVRHTSRDRRLRVPFTEPLATKPGRLRRVRVSPPMQEGQVAVARLKRSSDL